MYAFNFNPENNGIDHGLIFVAMPFDDKYDFIYDDLIRPATASANLKLHNDGNLNLNPFRTKNDIRTTSGWINVLEHLYTAQIVIGVLTGNNPNVFYELGIAHATQQIAKQILITYKGYRPTFDTKDLIHLGYNKNKIAESIEPLADKIVNAIETYKLEHEKKIIKARSMMGPFEFDVLMNHGIEKNFYIFSTDPKDYEDRYGKDTFERRIKGITNLCHQGLLYFNTDPIIDNKGLEIRFSYWWTGLGNDVLHFLKIINDEVLLQRRKALPAFFDK